MKPEHARKLGRLFVGGPASFEAFKNAKTPEAARDALDKIVRDNEPFIAATVRDLKARGLASPQSSVVDLADDDLMQAGRIGYAEAIKRFNPEEGALPPYAKRWIGSKVARAAAGDSTIHKPEQIRLPASALRAAEMIEAIAGREATAEEMGVTQERLDAWRAQPTVCAIDQVSPVSRIASDDPGPEDLLVLKELASVVDSLPPRQREVIRMIFWEELTPDQVAAELTIPVEVVMDLRDEALAELHACLS